MTASETLERLVAIDGPAGAGKSSVARQVAEALGYAYVDTGAMYRAVTLACLRAGVGMDPLDAPAVRRVLGGLDLRVGEHGEVWVDGHEVEAELRGEEVTARVSAVSALPAVREAMVRLQREVAGRLLEQGVGVVMDGRDIGSHVFPQARHRFFLDASLAERARRRREQRRRQGGEAEEDLQAWMERIQHRDLQDAGRALAPLTVADGAEHIDTTDLDQEQVLRLLLERVRG